jgi:hypothetical protein
MTAATAAAVAAVVAAAIAAFSAILCTRLDLAAPTIVRWVFCAKLSVKPVLYRPHVVACA